MCRWASLGESIPLLDGDLDPLICCLNEFSRERRSARVHHSQGGQIEFVDNRVFRKKEHDGWYNIGHGDLVVLDDVTPGFDVELGHDDAFESTISSLMDQAGQPVDVEEW